MSVNYSISANPLDYRNSIAHSGWWPVTEETCANTYTSRDAYLNGYTIDYNFLENIVKSEITKQLSDFYKKVYDENQEINVEALRQYIDSLPQSS